MYILHTYIRIKLHKFEYKTSKSLLRKPPLVWSVYKWSGDFVLGFFGRRFFRLCCSLCSTRYWIDMLHFLYFLIPLHILYTHIYIAHIIIFPRQYYHNTIYSQLHRPKYVRSTNNSKRTNTVDEYIFDKINVEYTEMEYYYLKVYEFLQTYYFLFL